MLRIRRPRLPTRSASDTSLTDSPADCRSLRSGPYGFNSHLSRYEIKKRPMASFYFMVEMMGIEPMSESASSGVSPSAAIVLKFRFAGRPIAGFRLGYPVGPLCYQELTQGFPACLTSDILPAGEQEQTRGAELSCQCEIVCSFSVYI